MLLKHTYLSNTHVEDVWHMADFGRTNSCVSGTCTRGRGQFGSDVTGE